jgi:hypothetical protein
MHVTFLSEYLTGEDHVVVDGRIMLTDLKKRM